MTTLAVLAKAPRPGRSKTRLCPPCTPEEAARVADAALRDTLDVAVAAEAARVVLVLDGDPVPELDPSIEWRPQGEGDLGTRLAAAFAGIDGPVLLIGMDTPQVSVGTLDDALRRVDAGRAVLGPAPDGGWWALGLRACPPGAFAGVPMSTSVTARHQRRRLAELGIHPDQLEPHRDVDHWPDALAVAASVPDGRFAAAVHAIARTRRPVSSS